MYAFAVMFSSCPYGSRVKQNKGSCMQHAACSMHHGQSGDSENRIDVFADRSIESSNFVVFMHILGFQDVRLLIVFYILYFFKLSASLGLCVLMFVYF